MPTIGFHTDAFTSAFRSVEQCPVWARANEIHWIGCGAIDGVSWIHRLANHPRVAFWADPVLLRNKMDRYGAAFSPLACASG